MIDLDILSLEEMRKSYYFWLILLLTIILFICFVMKYLTPIEQKNKNIHNDTDRHLKYINKILTEEEITHWLMFDTLLGAVRTKSIITADPDIDIGAYNSDYKKIMKLNDKIRMDGYELKRDYVHAKNIKDDNYMKQWKVAISITYNDTHIGDIMLYTTYEDGITRRVDGQNKMNYMPSMNTFPSWFINKFDKIEINNTFYNIPQDSGVLLRYWYGNNWSSINLSDNDVYVNITNSVKSFDKKLDFLTSFVEYKNVKSRPHLNDSLYTFPDDQKEWITKNDPINDN